MLFSVLTSSNLYFSVNKLFSPRLPTSSQRNRHISSEMSTTADWDWWWVFENMDGLTLDDRIRTSRVLHYWNSLGHSERNAEEQQYSEEPCSAQMDWKHFYAKCHFFQIQGMEPSPLKRDGENFHKAYWNLDARITAALTNTDHPRGSVNHTAGNRASSPRQPIRQSRAPVSRAVAPRQNGGSDDPPPYMSSQSNHAADRPPPYEAPRQERPRQEKQQHEQLRAGCVILDIFQPHQ